jgi:hypothetical protein
VPKLRNINPLGQVDLPLIDRQGDNGVYAAPDDRGYEARTAVPESGCLEAGEEFEVSQEIAEHLLEQAGNYELVKTPVTKADAKSERGDK